VSRVHQGGDTAAHESDVESVTSNGDFGPTRLTIATRACVADDRSGPRSLCAGARTRSGHATRTRGNVHTPTGTSRRLTTRRPIRRQSCSMETQWTCAVPSQRPHVSLALERAPTIARQHSVPPVTEAHTQRALARLTRRTVSHGDIRLRPARPHSCSPHHDMAKETSMVSPSSMPTSLGVSVPSRTLGGCEEERAAEKVTTAGKMSPTRRQYASKSFWSLSERAEAPQTTRRAGMRASHALCRGFALEVHDVALGISRADAEAVALSLANVYVVRVSVMAQMTQPFG
jgi:hypothetical protein